MLSADAMQRLNLVAEAVRARFEKGRDLDELFTTAYRWQHTQRVCRYGQILAEAEGADLEWVLAGCLLHDIAHFEEQEMRDHGRLGAEMSRPILEAAGYGPEAVDTVCHAIAAHVDGEAGDDLQDTVEADVVTDADNLDRFSTYRLLQWGAPKLGDFEALCDGAEERLERLTRYLEDGPLQTETGNRLFAEKLRSQISFMQGLLEDRDRTALPWT
jgi:putative nucleotidyltransferase with HDIG domain